MNFVKKHIKSILSVTLALILICSICVVSSIAPSASGTGAGLAEWAMNAYNSGWRYVYGGSSAGAVDCSGLIYSYCGGARVGTDQLNSASASGNVSAGIPRVHGLGLYQPGHVGVYVGGGMAVDARDESSGVCYQSTASKSWTKWFKLSAVSYPDTGWVKCNGNYYYYEDGQYIVNTSRTIDGESYSFSSTGVSSRTPDNMNSTAKKSSSGSNSSSNSSSDSSSKSSSSSGGSSSVLKLGSSGDKVTKLQNRLTELGFYNDAVTGYFGEATQKAYKAFQTAAGVTVDGIAGKSDLDILYSDDAPSANSSDDEDEDDGLLKVGDEGDDVEKVQDKLSELKYFTGVSSGYFGELTESAVKEFQEDNDLPTTGMVGELTTDKLFDEDAAENPDAASDDEVEEETEEEEETVQPETTESATEKAAEPKISETAKSAKANVEIAQKVVVKTNKLSRNALASANGSDKKVASISGTEEKNQSFLLWMLLVLGIAVIVSGFMVTLNHRRKKAYNGAHTRTKKKNNVTVRYW